MGDVKLMLIDSFGYIYTRKVATSEVEPRTESTAYLSAAATLDLICSCSYSRNESQPLLIRYSSSMHRVTLIPTTVYEYV